MSTSVDSSVVARWRLILGQSAEAQLTISSGNASIHLSEDELIMDQALAAIYDETSDIVNSGAANSSATGQRGAGSGKSAPRLAKWLGDVRNFFPEDIVSVIQHDAMERKELEAIIV